MVKKFLFFFFPLFFCIGKLKVCKTFLVWKFKLTLSVCVAPFFFAGSNLSINPSLLLFSRRGEVTSVLQSNWRCRLAIWQSFSMFCNPKITEWVNRINQKRIFFSYLLCYVCKLFFEVVEFILGRFIFAIFSWNLFVLKISKCSIFF